MREDLKRHIYAGIILVVSLAADLYTKYLAVTHIHEYERINVLGSFVQLTLLYNQGGLFGILQGYQAYFLVISLIVLVLLVLFYFFEKNRTMLFSSAMAFIISGALGNIYDRLSGRKGVVDFLYIGHDEVFRWPAFNIADAAIVVGAILLMIFFYLDEKKRRKEKPSDQ